MRNKQRRFAGAVPRLRNIPRGRAFWIAGCALLSLAVAFASGTSSLEAATRYQKPALALRLTGDHWAALALAQSEAQQHGLKPSVVPLAKQALEEQAIAPLPLSLMAMWETGKGNTARAASVAKLAERISRRDLFTQLLLIEQSVAADDYVGALRHYDIALRTHEPSRETLLPILTGALSDPSIRGALATYVRDGSDWMEPFVSYASRQGAAGDVARLLIAAKGPRAKALMQNNAAAIISGLTGEGRFGEARAFLQLLPGVDLKALGSAGFNTSTTDPRFGALAWTSINTGASSTAFENSTNSSARDARIVASFGEHGVALRRVLRLAPGAHSFSETRELVYGDSNSRVWWELKCGAAADSKTIWKSPDRPVAYARIGAPGPVIPENCADQVLELDYLAGENPQGLEFVVKKLEFAR